MIHHIKQKNILAWYPIKTENNGWVWGRQLIKEMTYHWGNKTPDVSYWDSKKMESDWKSLENSGLDKPIQFDDDFFQKK